MANAGQVQMHVISTPGTVIPICALIETTPCATSMTTMNALARVMLTSCICYWKVNILLHFLPAL